MTIQPTTTTTTTTTAAQLSLLDVMAAATDAELLTITDADELGTWSDGTTNSKTGDAVTCAVGTTIEETQESCGACPHLPTSEGGTATADGEHDPCYAWQGQVGMGHKSRIRAIARMRAGNAPAKWKGRTVRERYGFRTVAGSLSGRLVRDASIGDSGSRSPAVVAAEHEYLTRQGARVIRYTHQHDAVVAAGLAPIFVASVESLADADAAIDRGFEKAAAVLDWRYLGGSQHLTTPKGRKATVCPAIWQKHHRGRTVTCEACKLCTIGQRSGTVVVFPEHSPRVRGFAVAWVKRLSSAGMPVPRWLASVAQTDDDDNKAPKRSKRTPARPAVGDVARAAREALAAAMARL